MISQNKQNGKKKEFKCKRNCSGGNEILFINTKYLILVKILAF